MASLIGSSRCATTPDLEQRRRLRRTLAALAILLCAASGWSEQPPYLREALARFSGEVPAGWAYTQTTVRGKESTTERFDPSRPSAAQWTLVLHNGRPPPADELEKYGKFKAASAPPLTQAAFHRNDIDPGSFALVRENAARAVFVCSFRAESAAADKMLDHLQLQLTVHKTPAWIEEYALELRAPYSPVLGVKMNTLEVHMRFSPPGPDRPSLPALTTSLFAGRIFFVPTSEDLRVSFTEFTAVKNGP